MLENKKIKIPDLNIKKTNEPPKGYIIRKVTKKGVKIELSKAAQERIKQRLGLID